MLYFFFNPVNKNPKCIRITIRNIIRNNLFRKIPKCIRNASQIPIFPLPEPPSPVQFLSIFCFLHIHPQLLHLILNSHISAPPTHPKTSKKSKYLPTISVNPPHTQTNSFTSPPQLLPNSPHFNHFKQKQYFHKTTNLF